MVNRTALFAALARRVADAHLIGEPLGPIITELQALRRHEVTRQ